VNVVEINEINVFTFGDSRLVKTWSNVPYLLTKTLEEQGYNVNRIDISPNRYLQSIYNRIIHKISTWFVKDNVYLYERTYINYFLTFLRIKKANKMFPSADLNIFTNFSFYNKYSSKPNLLLCDWDLNIGIVDRMGRQPYFLEKKAIQRQEDVIEHSDIVISLFPRAAEKMRRTYRNQKIFHLNRNVINSLYNEELNEESILNIKQASFELLFIGNFNYAKGATLLIESFKVLKVKYPKITLNIVGMSKEVLGIVPDGVFLHGYLDKNDPVARKLYYDLMIRSKLFINPTPIWGGYSSTIEAMYFYNPIIIAPYDEFLEEFGREISFGFYCHEFSVQYLVSCITALFNDLNYKQISKEAHSAVSQYTWDKYVQSLMSTMKKHL
jgi:glycosyltransferase involved in cell wall biosynthesis